MGEFITLSAMNVKLKSLNVETLGWHNVWWVLQCVFLLYANPLYFVLFISLSIHPFTNPSNISSILFIHSPIHLFIQGMRFQLIQLNNHFYLTIILL